MKYLLCYFPIRLFISCVLSKLFISVRRGSAVLLSTAVHSSHDEVGGSRVSDVKSVLSLGGFTFGLEFALVSDLVTIVLPLALVLSLGLGFVNGSVVFTVVEAQLARSSSLDDLIRVGSLLNEKRLGNGVEHEGGALDNDVEGFELNVEGVVEVFDLEFSTPRVVSLVVVENAVSHLVVVDEEGEDLEDDQDEDADQPHHEEDLTYSVVEDVEEGVSPATGAEGPQEHHHGPSNNVEVESDPRCGSHQGPERHLVPRVVGVFHVLAFVDVKVVEYVEGGEGSVETPSHISGGVHCFLCGLLGFSAFEVCFAGKLHWDCAHLTFKTKNIINTQIRSV